MATKDTMSYPPDLPWEEYLNSIRYRYPYNLPPPLPEKVHPSCYIDGARFDLPGGTPGFHKRERPKYLRGGIANVS